MIDRPSLIADFLIDNWADYCMNGISKTPCPLTPALEAAIRATRSRRLTSGRASELVEKPQMRAVLHEHLDIDPGEGPAGWPWMMCRKMSPPMRSPLM